MMPRLPGQPLCVCCLAVRAVVIVGEDDGLAASLCRACASETHRPDPRDGYCPRSAQCGEPSRLVMAGVRA